LTGFLLAGIPMLVVLGFVRAVALLRRGTGASWSDAFGAFMIWQSTGLVVARASVQGLFAKEAEFLRTPKTAEDAHWWDAVRGNVGETVLSVLGLAGIVACLANPSGYGSVLAAVLLVWPTVAYGAAPYNSLSAQRAALPPQLRRRRRTEYQRARVARRLTYALAGLGVAGAATALAVVLLAPGKQPVVTPQLIGPARGHGVDYRHPATTDSGPSNHTSNSSPAPSSPPSSSESSSSPTPTPTPTTSSVTSTTPATTTPPSSTSSTP
jgi:hypothetical protein